MGKIIIWILAPLLLSGVYILGFNTKLQSTSKPPTATIPEVIVPEIKVSEPNPIPQPKVNKVELDAEKQTKIPATNNTTATPLVNCFEKYANGEVAYNFGAISKEDCDARVNSLFDEQKRTTEGLLDKLKKSINDSSDQPTPYAAPVYTTPAPTSPSPIRCSYLWYSRYNYCIAQAYQGAECTLEDYPKACPDGMSQYAAGTDQCLCK